jgi:hypothetical protein
MEHFGWIAPDENPNYKTTSWNEREDDYSSVSYWYQTGPSTFTARAPDAKDRALPNIERTVVYARDIPTAGSCGIGKTATQQLELYPDKQLLYMPAQAQGAWLEIPFEVKQKEPLRLLLTMTKAEDFGRYQAYVDGVKIGGVLDFYQSKMASEEFHLLDFWPDPGPHKLRLECVGKNPLSQGYYCGIESLRLRERRPRVMEMGHEKNKDWKAEPKLYR